MWQGTVKLLECHSDMTHGRIYTKLLQERCCTLTCPSDSIQTLPVKNVLVPPIVPPIVPDNLVRMHIPTVNDNNDKKDNNDGSSDG